MKFYNFNDYLLQSFGVLTFKNFAESALSETSLHDVSFLQDCLQLVLLVLEWECNGGFLSADSLDFALNVLLMQVEKVLMFLATLTSPSFGIHRPKTLWVFFQNSKIFRPLIYIILVIP